VLTHLLDGGFESFDLSAVASLGRDVRGLGTDDISGNRQALEHLVGIVAQQRSILEGAGFSFRGVAHREPVARTRRANPGPLPAGRKASSPAATEPARGQLGDGLLWAVPDRDGEALTPAESLVLGQARDWLVTEEHRTSRSLRCRARRVVHRTRRT